MPKEMTVIVLGILVIIVPYLGFPMSWRTILLVIAGLAIAITGFLLRGEAIARGEGRKSSFAESTPDSTQHDRQEGLNSLN